MTNLAIYLPYNYVATNPSVRLRRLLLRRILIESGIRADIIRRFEDLNAFDNILISSFDSSIEEQCISLRKSGRRLFYDHSEALFGFPHQHEVFNLMDYIVCCSSRLASITATHLNAITQPVVIPDIIEEPYPIHSPKEVIRPRVVHCAMGGNTFMSRELKPLIEEAGMDLVIISEWEDADIKWSQDTYLYEMAKCDLVICPQKVDLQPAKSNVKLTQAMALGMPVVCSPLPAYLEIVKHNENALIASTLEEWQAAFHKLKDLSERIRLGKAALASVQPFKRESIAKLWKSLLETPRKKVAFINDTLLTKYASYGDYWLEKFRFAGYQVDEFRYEDVPYLPAGYDLYFFIEVRYSSENISDVARPRILHTQERINLNDIPHFDWVVTPSFQALQSRGFVNSCHIPLPPDDLAKCREAFDFLFNLPDTKEARKTHNAKLHSQSIENFLSLLEPEVRWSTGTRDQAHIKYVDEKIPLDSRVLDVGSADGWLSLYLAARGRQVTCLDFVDRGLDWTRHQAERLGIQVELNKGFIEDIPKMFSPKSFDCILAFEILEHLDYLKVPEYLQHLDYATKPGGTVLVSLPQQDLLDNVEHLWSPSFNLIHKQFKSKKNLEIRWVDIPNHGVPGNWFISYQV